MKQEDKNQPDQNEKPLEKQPQDIGFDIHPIKAEPLNPLPQPSSGVPLESLPFNDREKVFLFIIVLLVVALAGISLIYASKFTIPR